MGVPTEKMTELRKWQNALSKILLVSTFLTSIGGMDIKLKCNDHIEKVYVRNLEKSGDRGWRETVQLSVSDKASIIAVQWSNVGGTTPALIASASTGIVSDDINWKCTTTQPEDNWYEEHYDSREWGNAAVVCRNDNCGNLSDSNFSEKTNWIRSTGGSLADRTYCRGQLGPVSLTTVTPGTNFTQLFIDDGVFRFNSIENRHTQVTSPLDLTPRLLAVRSRRWPGVYGWILASVSNGFISGENWKCKAFENDFPVDTWNYLNFDETSWSPAVIVPPITTEYKVIDNNAKMWYTATNHAGEVDCFCRGTVGVSAYVYCNDRGHGVYVDGVKMNEALIEREWRSIIPRTARLIAIEAQSSADTRSIRATFSNGFKTSERWKCSTVSHDKWYTMQFDDSTDDWKDARVKTSPDYIWEESDTDGTIFCRGWIECGCGPQFQCVPSIDRYNYKCICREGYAGETCEDLAVKCSDRPAVCGDHGRCVDIDDFYVCLCDDGYAGEKCDSDINECANNNPCQHDTACVNSIGSFYCNCADSGYEGHFCEQETDYCGSHPCRNAGTCTAQFKNFTCDCTNTGFGGSTCSTEINECESNPCQNGGVCENKINHFECDCTGTGYDGLTCSSDVDECLQNLPGCVSDTCINLNGSYTCTCVSGYTGLKCETDIDECADSKMNECTGQCSNQPGGYTCGCNDGYELKGKYDCVDIHECDRKSDNCDHICQNTIGSFVCSCIDGYALLGDGHSCVNIESESDQQTGLIAGVVVTVIIVLVVIAVAVILYRRRSRHLTVQNSPQEASSKPEITRQEMTTKEQETGKLPSEDPESPYNELDEYKMYMIPQRNPVEKNSDTYETPIPSQHTYVNT